MKNIRHQHNGFTMMELVITMGIMVLVSIFIHQIFFNSTDAVKLGLATSNIMSKGAAIQNQLTYDTDRDLMLGPAMSTEPGGFMVIVNHELPAYIRDTRAHEDDPAIRDGGVDVKNAGPLVIKKFRSDQLVFIRKTRKGELPISPPNGNFYGNIDDGRDGGYMRIWYGHLQRTQPDGSDPSEREFSDGTPDVFGAIPPSKNATGYNGLANEWILGRQAMHLIDDPAKLPPARNYYATSTPRNIPPSALESSARPTLSMISNIPTGVPAGLFYSSNPEMTSAEFSTIVSVFTSTGNDNWLNIDGLNAYRNVNGAGGYNYMGYTDVCMSSLSNEPYVVYTFSSGKRFLMPVAQYPLSRYMRNWNGGYTDGRSYGFRALGYAYVQRSASAVDPRLWVNPRPQDDPDDPNVAASLTTIQVAQQHAYLCGNVSDFIVEFAADVDNDGKIDRVRDVDSSQPQNLSIQWYGMPRANGGINQLAGGQSVNNQVIKPEYQVDDWAIDPGISSYAGLSYKYPHYDSFDTGQANDRRIAFVFRHDDGMPFIEAGDGRNSIWPHMLRIRYRVQDPRGRLQTEAEPTDFQAGFNNFEVPLHQAESEPGKWFEKIVWVNRPRGRMVR